jgi:hypothetical protein
VAYRLLWTPDCGLEAALDTGLSGLKTALDTRLNGLQTALYIRLSESGLQSALYIRLIVYRLLNTEQFGRNHRSNA